jgi:hypothetical protein
MGDETVEIDGVTYMADIDQLRELGLLAEINRRVLHPLGLALEMSTDNRSEQATVRVWDYRTDPEGVYFNGDESLVIMEEGARAAHQMMLDRRPVREEQLGYWIQLTAVTSE